MSKDEKLLTKLLLGNADNNFAFDDLVKIMIVAGFQMRIKGGSHHIFVKKGVTEIINCNL